MTITPPDPRLPRPKRAYFSQRSGRGPRGDDLSFAEIANLLAQFLAKLRTAGYLQQAFGFSCVDPGGDEDGEIQDPDAYFRLAIGRQEIWPFDASANQDDIPWDMGPRWESWDEGTWFDVLEVLFDLVSKPIDGWIHDYNDCGTHYTAFDRASAEQLYRNEINWILSLGELNYEMSAEGEILEAAPEGFEQLIDAALPSGTETDQVAQRVQEAEHLFRARGSSEADRLRAVRELADVLEHLRGEMKAEMLKGDESDLFKLINGFAVRHNNPKQLRQYDSAIWHRWMFYVFLATIHAVLRVRERSA